MNNNLINFILGTVLVTWVLIWVWLPDSNASTEDLKATIHQVAKDYRNEQWFNGQCYIGSTPVTLAQMLYGLWIAEWGFLPWSAWLRTNNPWSLRKWMWLKTVVKTHNIDNAKKRPEYATMYDWLYEKAHLIASPNFRYKCNYTFEAAFAYVNWPRAERTEGKIQNARNHLNNALRGAMKFSNTEIENVKPESTENKYLKAKQQEERTQQLFEEYLESKAKTNQLRKECVDEWITCK